MSEAEANKFIGAFLADHPEYRPDVATLDVKGESSTALTTDGLYAFIEWSLRNRLCDPKKARDFKKYLKEQSWKNRGGA